MKVGDRVKTPNSYGRIIAIDGKYADVEVDYTYLVRYKLVDLEVIK